VAGTNAGKRPEDDMTAPARASLEILVIDEQPILRDALARVVAQVDSEALCIEAADVGEGAALAAAHPHVALAILDVGPQAAAAPVLLRRLREALGERPVLVTAPCDDAALARVVLEEGARGFLSKRAPTPVFREVVRLLLAGGVYVPPSAVGMAEPEPPAPVATIMGTRRVDAGLRLTARQQAVLALMLKGRPNKLICRTLNLREGTVKTHIANIFRALNVNNRTEAAYAVTQLGIDLPEIDDRVPRLNAARRPPLKLVA
jgi:DNA-binding NarL/FixJ family response regulator